MPRGMLGLGRKRRTIAALLCACMLLMTGNGMAEEQSMVIERFDEQALRWTLSEDASYPLAYSDQVAANVTRVGSHMLYTGRVSPAWTLEGDILSVQRTYPLLETQGFYRCAALWQEAMDQAAHSLRLSLTPRSGGMVGACFGMDAARESGWAVVLSDTDGKATLMKYTSGLLMPYLDQNGLNVEASLWGLDEDTPTELDIQWSGQADGQWEIVVSLDGLEEMRASVPAGSGNAAAMVATANGGRLAALWVDDAENAINAAWQCSMADTAVVDSAFKGTLTSEPFVIDSAYLTFRIGGTDSDRLQCQLVEADTDQVLMAVSGPGTDDTRRVLWDVTAYAGKQVQIRVTDRHAGGYLVLDDLRQTDQTPDDMLFSLLHTQVGYAVGSVKKAYIRTVAEQPLTETSFSLVDEHNETVYTGAVAALEPCWGSRWYVLDFTDFRREGAYRLSVGKGEVCSTQFTIASRALTEGSLIDVALNQLDLRRAPGKMGWRDSSTNELRELHAQVMAVHTMLDLLEKQQDWLSDVQRARCLDNIAWGLQYVLSAQERTDDPMTDGRFIHDLYPSQYTAEHLRSWFDMVYAMSALARSYPVLLEADADLAQQVKDAFDVSYALCTRRPYYLEEELTIESPAGRGAFQNNAIKVYGITDPLWEFDLQLRTRDRLMYAWACTLMYEGTQDERYLDTAREMARLVCESQYTDAQNPIDGTYGFFYEFNDGSNAMMLEWIQNNNLMLGNQTPTTMAPLLALMRIAPEDPDAALWYNTVRIYTQHFVKASAGLTPLGIYPIGVYDHPTAGGVKFFQTINHGATSHYGNAAYNMMMLALYFDDIELQHLAENNVQFVAGLHPGFPTDATHTAWQSRSLLYLIGNRSFSGYYHGGAYLPPIGSGINGFSASEQFVVKSVAQTPDLPLGIIDDNGKYQFNEDYIPHGMGYAAGVAAVEATCVLPIQTTMNGSPVSVTGVYEGDVSGTITTDADGRATLSGLPAGTRVVLRFDVEGVTFEHAYTAVAGTAEPWIIDFASRVALSWDVTDTSGRLVITNAGTQPISPEVTLLCDGANLTYEAPAISLAVGESTEIPFTLTERGSKPYLVYACVKTAYSCQVSTFHD